MNTQSIASPSLLRVLPEREGFSMPGKAPACLLLHGFTGSPLEMRTLADAIHDQLGYAVSVPLWPGHGGLPNLLEAMDEDALLAAGRAALAVAREQHSRVVVIGFSMGAAIMARLVAERPPAAFIMLAPMLQIRNPLVAVAGVARRAAPYFYPLKAASIDNVRKETSAFDLALDLEDPAVLKQIKGEVRFPVAALAELQRLQVAARKTAGQIRTPTLIAQGNLDLTLDPAGARRFFARLAATDKQYINLPGADHDIVMPTNRGHRQMIESMIDWLRNHFG